MTTKNLGQLRCELEEVTEQARALNEKYGAAPMPRADAAQLDSLLGRAEQLGREIDDRGRAAQEAGQNTPVGAQFVTVDDKPVRVMRNAADFRAHYTGRGESRAQAGLGLAEFMRAAAGIGPTDRVQAALAGGTDADGGYLLPSTVMPQILEALVPASSVLSAGAGLLPLGMSAKSFALAGIDAIPTAAWRAENGAVAESQPTFRAVVATPRSLSFYLKVSRELLADAVGMQQAMSLAIAQAFAKELDRAALYGNGVAPQPLGIKGTTNVNLISNGANGASLATTKWANFHSAAQAVLEDDAPMPTAAIMSPRTRVALGALADSTGQPLMVPPMLQPMQMLTTTQVPNDLVAGASTDTTDLFVGDFTKLLFAMRERLSIQRSDHIGALNGQVVFVCHARADILLTYPKAFAVVSGVRP